MSSIHGLSHKAISAFRDKPAALAVYWIYVSRTNNEGVAWPSLRGLVHDTEWSINIVKDARKWLVEHGAIETVDGYIRPKWRKLEGEEKTHVRNIDKSEYYRVTGTVMVNAKEIPMLYFGSMEHTETEGDDYTHVSPDDTSGRIVTDVSPEPTSGAARHSPRDTELSIGIDLDSMNPKLGTNSNASSAPDGTDGAGLSITGFTGQDTKPATTTIKEKSPAKSSASKTSPKSSAKKPPSEFTSEINKEIGEIIKAWKDNCLMTLDPDKNYYVIPSYRKEAGEMALKGVTGQMAIQWFATIRADKFWKTQGIEWYKVKKDLRAWCVGTGKIGAEPVPAPVGLIRFDSQQPAPAQTHSQFSRPFETKKAVL